MSLIFHFIFQMGDEDVNFRWFLDKFKNGKIEWDVFLQMMKVMISTDFSKSKELNFVLLEELKQFKELETEINILRQENESLKGELQRKYDLQQISLSNLDTDSDKDSNSNMDIVSEIKIVENSLEDTTQVQNSGIADFSSESQDSDFENRIEFKTENLNTDDNDFMTRIKIEELNSNESSPFISKEPLVNNEIFEVEELISDENPEDRIQVSKNVSVTLIPLSESTLKHYLKDNNKSINSNLNKRNSCEKCDKTFSSVQKLKLHVERIHEGLEKNKCNNCGKSFNFPTGLKRHIEQVHEVLKNHKCNQCDKRFYLPAGLKRHSDIVHRQYKVRTDNSIKFTCLRSSNFV